MEGLVPGRSVRLVCLKRTGMYIRRLVVGLLLGAPSSDLDLMWWELTARHTKKRNYNYETFDHTLNYHTCPYPGRSRDQGLVHTVNCTK